MLWAAWRRRSALTEGGRRLNFVLLYLVLVLPATLLLNFAFVNFHAPDDYDHVKRAYTLVHAPLAAVTPPGQSTGAMIDAGLADYIAAQRPVSVIAARPLPQADAAAFRSGGNIGWTGQERFSELPGAIGYFPALYAPQTLALEIGRRTGATIEHSVLGARLANGLVAIALVALGLRLLPFGHSLVLAVLLLPRSLLQFASNSADPILYGLALVVVAIGLQRADRLNRLRPNGLAAAALFIAAAVRPPIAALGCTLGLQALRNRKWLNLLVLAAAVAGAALWTLWIRAQVLDLRCGIGEATGPRAAAFATQWPRLIGHSLSDRGLYYLFSFIGHFGWGDGLGGRISQPLLPWMYASSIVVLGLSVGCDVRSRATLDRLARLSLAVGAAAAVLLTFFALYVGCSGSEPSVIVGVQGRYFAPALFAVAPALSGLAPAAAKDRLQTLFPVVLAMWVAACVAGMAWEAQALYRI